MLNRGKLGAEYNENNKTCVPSGNVICVLQDD